MRVIGTAGHVDHGKSTLVEALTGTHPDRLKEEREREMTIELGFAWLTLPDGEEVGIVDVPGHRDFIENMVAGVGGIDAALFVIAADEGVMPQTREHLAILDILQVQGGIVALTKIDLIDDPSWLEMVEEDIRGVLAGTVLEEAPILRVSARTRQGLTELIQVLQKCLAARPMRPDLGRPRLPVDRVFTVVGFGTVVTGTLMDGRLKLGDELQILPSEYNGRVRGLQTHKHKEDVAVPGSRTAINISGVDLEQVKRGDLICHPGDYKPTRRLDVSFRLLAGVSQDIQHNMSVKLFLGTSEVIARLRLLGVESLSPGQEGWLQLELQEPVVAVRGDHYILRRPSPGETLGGGMVVDPQPQERHKRFHQETLAALESLSRGTPEEIILQALQGLGVVSLQEVVARSNLAESTTRSAVLMLEQQGEIIALEAGDPDTLIASRVTWDLLKNGALQIVRTYHRSFPLRAGMPREELKSRLKTTPRVYSQVIRRLVSEKILAENGPVVFLSDHVVSFNTQQQHQIDRLVARFAAAPYAPPTLKECQAEIGEELLSALLDARQLVFVPPDVLFRTQDYDFMVSEIRKYLLQQGTLTAAQVRDHFNTSRRYVLALLEHLDALGITIRQGDMRRLK